MKKFIFLFVFGTFVSYTQNRTIPVDTMVVTTHNITVKGQNFSYTAETGMQPVWNGKEFSNVEVCQTGEDQDLVKVSFSDSSTLECTPYHKFYIQEKYIKIKMEE